MTDSRYLQLKLVGNKQISLRVVEAEPLRFKSKRFQPRLSVLALERFTFRVRVGTF